MKCPQCRRENQFPVPGLCPDCYKQWKGDMRARYGPGPWPHQPGGVVGKDASSTQMDSCNIQEDGPALENDVCVSVARSVQAVLDRLQEVDDEEGQEFLVQLDTFLREVARMVVCSVATASTDDRPIRSSE